jgi:hypothetical protein
MLNRVSVVAVGLLGAALVFPANPRAQDGATQTWPDPVLLREPVAEEDKKPAPRRSLAGAWGSREGNQAKGVQLRPYSATPIEPLPFTPYGLEVYESYKPLEGAPPRAVPPAEGNDPRARCEPLGFPRHNHYDLAVQILEDEHKVAILYGYDQRWRVIWTDGRSLPRLVDGGVEIDGQYWASRWFGYSVGRWVDDYTLEAQTVGMMPEDKVWLDNIGRPISDQLRVTETFRRVDLDTMVWSETIEDPKMYTRPWQTMELSMTLQDPRTDAMNRICSPGEIEAYNAIYGNAASGR